MHLHAIILLGFSISLTTAIPIVNSNSDSVRTAPTPSTSDIVQIAKDTIVTATLVGAVGAGTALGINEIHTYYKNKPRNEANRKRRNEAEDVVCHYMAYDGI